MLEEVKHAVKNVEFEYTDKVKNLTLFGKSDFQDSDVRTKIDGFPIKNSSKKMRLPIETWKEELKPSNMEEIEFGKRNESLLEASC